MWPHEPVSFSYVSTRSLVFADSSCLLHKQILINSAKRLHKGMLNACMRTRLTFFEENPSGESHKRLGKREILVIMCSTTP